MEDVIDVDRVDPARAEQLMRRLQNVPCMDIPLEDRNDDSPTAPVDEDEDAQTSQLEHDDLGTSGMSPRLRMCSLCKQTKSNNDFNRSKKTQRGSRFDYYCKLCRDSVRLKSRSRLPNFVRMMHFELCKKARKRHCEVEVTAEDLMHNWKVQRGLCALSGVPMTHNTTSKQVNCALTNTNIDRVDPTGPYTADNVQLVCGYVQQCKQDSTNEQFLRMCRSCVEHEAALSSGKTPDTVAETHDAGGANRDDRHQ